MADEQLSRCRGCNRQIEWIEFDGNKIAIDPKASTFQWDDQTRTWKRSSASVVHNAICPYKDQFTSRKE